MQRVDLLKYLVNKKIFDGVTVTLTKSYNRWAICVFINFCASVDILGFKNAFEFECN